jgi:putative pyruvate formate lyase activating enzyme
MISAGRIEAAEMQENSQVMKDQDDLKKCIICPRECGVDRMQGALGYCKNDASMNVAAICIHKGEEPVISGEKGICNIFFNHCNLQCTYCQNHQISSNQAPKKRTLDQLHDVVDTVENILAQGISAVGFVTPSHQIAQMHCIIKEIERRGHTPTTVYNTNAYDKAQTIAELAKVIDVYLPDLKYSDSILAGQYSGASNYPVVAQAALKEMFRQKGPDIVLDEQGYIRQGMIVRHLVLPGQIENSLQCLRFIAQELSPETHVSLMSQYAPPPSIAQDSTMGRCLRPDEYDTVVQEMERLGISNGWIQELESVGYYQPDFSQSIPFQE